MNLGFLPPVLPIAVAHGEGRAEFVDEAAERDCTRGGLVSLRWVDNYGKVALTYPSNPNGSPAGITGLTTTDGRVTILMPHPERAAHELLGSTDGRAMMEALVESASEPVLA